MNDYTRKDLPHIIDTLKLIEKNRAHFDSEEPYKRFKNVYRRITGKEFIYEIKSGFVTS